eukprot:762851-Hanusia_phi.AAC.5
MARRCTAGVFNPMITLTTLTSGPNLEPANKQWLRASPVTEPEPQWAGSHAAAGPGSECADEAEPDWLSPAGRHSLYRRSRHGPARLAGI